LLIAIQNARAFSDPSVLQLVLKSSPDSVL